jgi:hypothetical protein
VLLLLAASLFAQDDPGPVWIRLSGRVDATYARRDRRLDEAALWTPGGVPFRSADAFILPDTALRLDIESPAGLAVVEVGNLPLHFTSSDPRLQHDRLGQSPAVQINLLQAWVEPIPELRLGLQDFDWDPTGRGHPIFLAPSRSESPWGELPDSTVPPFPSSGTNTVPQTRRDRLRPVGVTARLDCLDLTLFTLLLAEGGAAHSDETISGAIYQASVGDFRFGAVIAYGTADDDQRVWTAGLTASVSSGAFFAGAEGYAQRGDSEGTAFRVIARYADGIRIQATATRIGGDRRGDDREEGRFLSYEDNDATLIVEGNEFGLDIDTNYETVQLSIAIPFEIDGVRLQPQVLGALFRFIEAVPEPPDPPAAVSGRSRTLGVEIDLSLEATLSSQFTLTAGVGWLLGADALENFTLRRENHTSLATLGFRFRF